MDRFQRQSVMLMISNIEAQMATMQGQLGSLRQLVGMTGPATQEVRGSHHVEDSDKFTTSAEDDEIADALGFGEDEKDKLMQDLFKTAQEDISLTNEVAPDDTRDHQEF
jgi:hypothetical protein